MKAPENRKEISFLFVSSHLQSFAVRMPTVERQEKAATHNQDPYGVRAIQWLPGLHWSVSYK